MRKILLFCTILLSWSFYGQEIQFLSPDHQPIKDLIIINNDGKLIATTNDEGKISKEKLSDSKFIIPNHRAFEQDTLWVNSIQNNQVTLKKIREQQIPEVNIPNPNKDFISISGYFNTYVTNNGEFNIYIDGMIEYVVDKKSNKIKDKILKEYRSFILKSTEQNRKKIASIVFDFYTDPPKMEHLVELLNGESKFKKNNNLATNEIDFHSQKSTLTDKEMKLFGYVFHQLNNNYTYTFGAEPIAAKNLLQHNQIISMELKHKSENEFTSLKFYSNFYPIEIAFKNKNELEKGIKFNKNKSQFTNKYWENEQNASVFKILSTRFKENFQLQ